MSSHLLMEMIHRDISKFIDGKGDEPNDGVHRKKLKESLCKLISDRFESEGFGESSVVVVWQVKDIKLEKPDWTDEQCADFLSGNQDVIAGTCVENGLQAIKTLLED